jgi:hypothetical protein
MDTMKFNVMIAGTSHGTIEVTEEVYLDDDALLSVLANAGYVDLGEVLEIVEEEENQIDIFEYDTGTHLVSLILIH